MRYAFSSITSTSASDFISGEVHIALKKKSRFTIKFGQTSLFILIIIMPFFPFDSLNFDDIIFELKLSLIYPNCIILC